MENPSDNRAFAMMQSAAGNRQAFSSGSMDMKQLASNVMDESISNIPAARKQAYLQAKEKAPQLVASESDAAMFMRRCDGNHTAAAERLCLYWEERLRVFGPDRAFLPLDLLTGNGALSRDEVLSLQAGFPSILPPSTTGQKVILCDRRKAIPSSPECRLRCDFFVHHILAKADERTQTEGIVILRVLMTPRFPSVDYEMSARLLENEANIFPTKCHVHFLVIPPIPKAGKNSSVQEIIDRHMKLAKSLPRLASVHLHVERESGQLLRILSQDLKLTHDGIPLAFGGGWRIEHFFREMKARESRDRRLEYFQQKKTGASSKIAAAPSQDVAAAAASSQDEKKKMTDAERQEKRRLADVMHSRRKRERKKKQVEDLEHQAKRVREDQQTLKEEHIRLQDLVRQAQSLVTTKAPTSSAVATSNPDAALPRAAAVPNVAASAATRGTPPHENNDIGRLLFGANHLIVAAAALHDQNQKKQAARQLPLATPVQIPSMQVPQHIPQARAMPLDGSNEKAKQAIASLLAANLGGVPGLSSSASSMPAATQHSNLDNFAVSRLLQLIQGGHIGAGNQTAFRQFNTPVQRSENVTPAMSMPQLTQHLLSRVGTHNDNCTPLTATQAFMPQMGTNAPSLQVGSGSNRLAQVTALIEHLPKQGQERILAMLAERALAATVSESAKR